MASQRSGEPSPPATRPAQDAPPPATLTPISPAQSNVVADLSRLSYRQLQARSEELKDQRQELADRRGVLAQSYEAATGANREGIGARLQVLDNNIVQFENQIAAVGQELGNKAGTEQPPTPPLPGGGPSGDTAGVVFSTILGTMLVTVLLMRRFVRRRWGAPPRQNAEVQGGTTERLDRIEQAVDTIAVEIERVSENQRFMTRLMTETQLGASLAAVRSSTEMAKSAAAEAPVETG